jgi:hypothetical protein
MLNQLHSECWLLAMDRKNRGRMFAVDRVIAISEARRKLMGLDVPVDKAMMSNTVVVREVPSNYLAAVEAPKS